MRSLDPLPGDVDVGDCGCGGRFRADRLVIDATECQAGGTLGSNATCLATAIDALFDSDASTLLVRSTGVERAYEGASARLLVAAGRFGAAVAHHEPRLADRVRLAPLRIASDAVARPPPVRDVAIETGLVDAARAVGYEPGVSPPPDLGTVLRPYIGPTVARSRIRRTPPAGAELRESRELDTDGEIRVYRTDTGPVYHLDPLEYRLAETSMATLARARQVLVTDESRGQATGWSGGRPPRGVVETVANSNDPVGILADVLQKHTDGYGVLSDLFADPLVSDVFATAPVAKTPLRVVVDGETMPTNVRLTAAGARTLASRFRRESGRAFSRATPTLDATAHTNQGRIRVAGIAAPASDGMAFAFRDHGHQAWTLPGLLENGTVPARAAALLSLAVERDAAGLIAGTRGAGKTTLLGALLWEMRPQTRVIVIEDTPELPVNALSDGGRDVQAIRTSLDDGPSIPPVEALRTALRLGNGALVLGEVRGEEASVLYEAMRVGASANATLGTIHGSGAREVRERVVSDLGVPLTSFGSTDFIVTTVRHQTQNRIVRRVGAIEELVRDGDDVHFAELFAMGSAGTAATGRMDRGDSRLIADLALPDESYADVLAALAARTDALESMAAEGRTDPDTVAATYATERR